MTCTRYGRELDRRGRRRLTPEIEAALAEHLRACPACQAERERRETLLAALDAAGEGPDPDAGRLGALASRVARELATTPREAADGGLLDAFVPVARAWVPRLAVAALVLVAVSVGLAWRDLASLPEEEAGLPVVLEPSLEQGLSDDVLLEAVLGPEEQP